MENTSKYIDSGLLEIRLSALRRNLYVIGAIFLTAFLGFFAVGMLQPLADRGTYLVSAILVALGFSLVSVLIKYEVTKALVDFMR